MSIQKRKGLKQRDEKSTKVLAWLLVFMMLFTATGMNVAAEEVVVETEEHAENVEAKPGADVALEKLTHNNSRFQMKQKIRK